MGAGSRKINNQRSQTLFNQGQDVYKEGQNLANNPFAPGEEQGLRDRALRPIQSAYAANERKMKQAALTSGGAPNLIAALSKSARDRTQQLSDASMDINTAISGERFNRGMAGRQYGLSGLGVSAGAPKNEGFNWGKLGSTLAGIGSGFLTGGFNPIKPPTPKLSYGGGYLS